MSINWLLFAVICGLHFASARVASVRATAASKKCDQSPLQIVFLFDLSPTNSTDFSRQQSRVVETIRHIDVLTHSRNVSFGFVVFHRQPVLLSPLNSPKSSDSSKVTEQVESVRPRRHADTSPAKALDLAAEQIEKNGREGAKSLVFLIHDGSNSDLIAETLEAVDRLRGQHANVYAISGSEDPNILALAGYTRQRERIYSNDADRVNFLAAIDKVIGLCSESERQLLTLSRVADDIEAADFEVIDSDTTHSNYFNESSANCARDKQIDLMIVLDTSGSVFTSFAEERELASNLIRKIDPALFEQNMQVGLVSFASEPMVLLPLSRDRAPATVITRIQNVEFTGMNTRIADAVELALTEVHARRRMNAMQVVVLVTDGHGQEFWSQAQTAGRRLQESGAQVFVATTLTDYNLPEILLYAGDDSRVFVGPSSAQFLEVVGGFINKCLGNAAYEQPVLGPTFVVTGNDVGRAQTEEPVLEDVNSFNVDGDPEEEEGFVSVRDREEARKKAELLRKYLEEQKGLPRSADCDTDLFFVIERSQRTTFNFSDQLELTTRIVDGIAAEDVDSGKVRLGLATFSKIPRIMVPLESNTTSKAFNKKIRNILPFNTGSDLRRALDVAVKEINRHRRPEARVVLVVVAAGKNNEENLAGIEAPLKTLDNSDVFAVSLNPFNDVGVLKKLTGDQWRVFVDSRIRQFTRDVSSSLSSCSLAAREHQKTDLENDSHEPESSVEKVEHLAIFAKKLDKIGAVCSSDNIDLELVLDVSTADLDHFDEQKQVAMDLVKQAPSGDFGKKLRIGVTVFNKLGRTAVPLNNSLTRDELLFELDRIQNTGDQASIVAGIQQAIADVVQFRRSNSRLILVLISDSNSADSWHRVQKAGRLLKKMNPQVYAVALAEDKKNAEELLVYTDSKKRVFNKDKTNLFLLSAKNLVYGCNTDSKNLHDIAIAAQEEAEVQNVEQLDKVAVFKSSTPAASVPTLAGFTDGQGKLMFQLTTTEEPEQHIRTLFSEDCTVDLMFIIDTSMSVANEFQKQLQFAVDLVKRLPSDDFETRVNVAAVSFYKTAKIEFPFGQFREKSHVLDGLFAIKHTGGSTSAVSGVELAVDEIQRGRRQGARLMVVLVSDGNSQDLWENVVAAADRLRSINADVYAVTVSHDYFFRELELYAGNKWFVYIDARIRQFLDEAEMSVIECRNPSIPATISEASKTGPRTKLEEIATTLASLSPTSTSTPMPESCQQDIVDLVIILDTSTSVEKEFYAEKSFALNLIKVLPESDFTTRIRVALIKFNSQANVQFKFDEKQARNDILYEIERVEHTGGQTSLVSGVRLALKTIANQRRPDSRLVTLIVSDGNSQDEWANVQTAARKLRKTGSEIYAVTLSEKYYFDELKEYTGNDRHIYTGARIEQFIQEVGQSVVSCPGRLLERVTLAPNVEVSATPATIPFDFLATTTPAPGDKPEKLTDLAVESPEPEFALALDDPSDITVIEREDSPIVQVGNGKCKYSKMDIIMILDASTSRMDVFEHQRELALSLVERLPLTKDNTQVATGLISFTSTPTLRQTLGLGRDKLMVRKAIEDIKYRGGSTLTSKAVELAVKDLERGRRPDALQVVVLMNDGISQDPWEKLLMAAEKLKNTNAERFAVALGDDIDLRELRRYGGKEERIYRDGSTERFLSDVVNLLNGGEIDCQEKPDFVDDGFPQASQDECLKPKLDVVVVFDATAIQVNQDDPLTSNKYLLLDILGSLPANDDVKVSITSFGKDPKLEHKFSDPQDRDSLFERIEGIQPLDEKASYSKAVKTSVEYYNEHRRSDARGLLLIVGDGDSTDENQDKSLAANLVKNAQDIDCHAVDSGKEINEKELAAYTGDVKRVYNYDRNGEFAKELLRLATLGQSEHCVETRTQANRDDGKDESFSSASPFLARDLSNQGSSDKDFGGDINKLVSISRKSTLRPATPTTQATSKKLSTAQPTTTAKTTTKKPSPKTTRGPKKNVTLKATRLTTTQISTTKTPKLSAIPDTFPTPKPSLTPTPIQRHFTTPALELEDTTEFTPGCLLDVILIVDSSGSVEDTFTREKELAAGIINKLRIGPENARVALIKFAAADKVRTILTLDGPQGKKHVLRNLARIQFSSGTTAIHMALLQAISEYSPLKGARPGKAQPLVIIFTDGFSQKDTAKEAELLRQAIPNVFAVAINHEYPISRVELERITGDPKRVFTDSNINDLHQLLADKFRTC